MPSRSELKERITFLHNKIASLDTEQNALKILANSGYGSIGNQYFRYFQLENAEAITLTGQFVIRYIENELNGFLNKLIGLEKDRVIILDTDSVVLELSDLFIDSDIPVEDRIDILDNFAKQTVQPHIEKTIKRIETILNSFPKLLSMKREIIANKTIVLAKKRYIMNVFDKEGVRFKEAKKKIMGIEAVRSSTPPLCKDMIKNTLDVFFTSDNEHILNFIEECRRRFFAEEDLAKISFPRGLQSLSDYENKTQSIPIHVSAAFAFNKFIKEQNLTKKYEIIKSGEKIKFCYLTIPNPFHSHVIGWTTTWCPKELELEKFIDKNKHFQVGYLNGIESIITAIGWQTELSSDLNDMF